jgi:ubiquinone/menaquinone biosynthesis C-methylase UbiE
MTQPSDETARVRDLYDAEAPRYDWGIAIFERLLFAGGRGWVCSRARGDVLELAVGTGRNLALYPTDVRLTAIELSPAMLERARRRARELGRDGELVPGDAQALPFADETFDTVTCTLSLCTIPNDRAAVAEATRVLRPGGRFVALEHVRSSRRRVRAAQQLLDPWAVRFEADHLAREPLEHLAAQGLVIDELERSKLGIVERVAAHKPTDSAR